MVLFFNFFNILVWLLIFIGITIMIKKIKLFIADIKSFISETRDIYKKIDKFILNKK